MNQNPINGHNNINAAFANMALVPPDPWHESNLPPQEPNRLCREWRRWYKNTVSPAKYEEFCANIRQADIDYAQELAAYRQANPAWNNGWPAGSKMGW